MRRLFKGLLNVTLSDPNRYNYWYKGNVHYLFHLLHLFIHLKFFFVTFCTVFTNFRQSFCYIFFVPFARFMKSNALHKVLTYISGICLTLRGSPSYDIQAQNKNIFRIIHILHFMRSLFNITLRIILFWYDMFQNMSLSKGRKELSLQVLQ